MQCQVPCLHIMDPNRLSTSLYLCPGKLLDRSFSPSKHCNEARQVFVRMSSSEVSVASRMGSNDLRLSLTLNPPPLPPKHGLYTHRRTHSPESATFSISLHLDLDKDVQRLRKIQTQNMAHNEGHTRSSKSH